MIDERDLLQEYHGDRPLNRAGGGYTKREAQARVGTWDQEVRDTSNHTAEELSDGDKRFYDIRGLGSDVVFADVTHKRGTSGNVEAGELIRRARFTKGRDATLDSEGEVEVASTVDQVPSEIEKRHPSVLSMFLVRLCQICRKEVDGSRLRDLTVDPGATQKLVQDTLKEIGESNKLFEDPNTGSGINAHTHAREVLSSIKFKSIA